MWRIKGRLNQVLDYIENDEKTKTEDLESVLKYATQKEKTGVSVDDEGTPVIKQLVSGVKCTPEIAFQEMRAVKKHFGKEGGTLAYHGYQSFAPGECTPEEAHEIGKQLIKELYGDEYQVVIATHLDKKNHLHNHFVINTVSRIDGIKFHRTAEDYKQMQEVSDRICREHGLSVIKGPKGRGKNYGEWYADKNGNPTVRGTIRKDIDRAIAASTTEIGFIQVMTEMGYEIKTRGESGQPLKYPGIKPPGAKGYFRFHKLGEGYSLDDVKDRIYRNIHKTDPFPEMEDKTAEAKYSHYLEKGKKASGIYRLYLYYCYELHIIEVHPAHLKRVSFAMRQDLQKLDKLDEQTRFLGRNGINTLDDLSQYREHASNDLEELAMRRTELRNELKRATRNGSEKTIQTIKDKITDATTEMRRVRKELSMCDSIEQRSAQIEREMTDIEKQEKEKITDEQLFRGTGRTGSEVVPRGS